MGSARPKTFRVTGYLVDRTPCPCPVVLPPNIRYLWCSLRRTQGARFLRFTNNFRYLLLSTHAADSEAILVDPVNVPCGAKSRSYQHHKVNHIGALLVSHYPSLLQSDHIQFDGPNCVEDFLEWLFTVEACTSAVYYKTPHANKNDQRAGVLLSGGIQLPYLWETSWSSNGA